MSTITTAKYLFVLSTGTSKPRKEIELQDAEARAHAARYSHGKRKFIKSLVKKPPARPSSETSSEEDEEAALFLKVLGRTSGHGGLSVLVGQGRGDPFDAYALKPVPPYVHELLDFAIRFIWPGSCPDSNHVPVIKSYMQTIISSPVGLHASVSAQIANIPIHSFRNDLAGQEKLARARLKHQNETFRLIKEEISTLESTPSTLPSNGILSAVAILSLDGLSRTTSLQQAHPFSPLATAQNLHIYGRMNLVPQHIAGLYLLVKQKGGVGKIENHSLVDLIKSVDLNSASRKLTAPGLMWEDPREVIDFLFRTSYSHDAPALALGAVLSSGFPILPQLTLSTLQVLTRTTIGLDHYHRRTPNSPTLATLVQSRYSAQHRLLSLPQNPQTTTNSEIIAETCRLAMLIYSDMALLPFPPESRVKPRLARLLLDQLERLEGRWKQSGETEADFLAWAVVLGGIAAFSTGMRGEFVRFMWEARIIARYGSWDVLHEKLRTFLWWDPVCENSGMTFWDESLATRGSSQSKDLVVIPSTLGS